MDTLELCRLRNCVQEKSWTVIKRYVITHFYKNMYLKTKHEPWDVLPDLHRVPRCWSMFRIAITAAPIMKSNLEVLVHHPTLAQVQRAAESVSCLPSLCTVVYVLCYTGRYKSCVG